MTTTDRPTPKPLSSLTPARIGIRGEAVHLVSPNGFDQLDATPQVVSLCGRTGEAYTEHLERILPDAACERCELEADRVASLVHDQVELWSVT